MLLASGPEQQLMPTDHALLAAATPAEAHPAELALRRCECGSAAGWRRWPRGCRLMASARPSWSASAACALSSLQSS